MHSMTAQQKVGMNALVVANQAAAMNSNGLNMTITASLSPVESKRNYAISSFLNGKNFRGMSVTRVVLPNDAVGAAHSDVSDTSNTIKQVQSARTEEYFRQISMPWLNGYMHTSTDQQRLSNPSQSSFVHQPQMTIPSIYGQFYAFMHAMSAAFGTLQRGPNG